MSTMQFVGRQLLQKETLSASKSRQQMESNGETPYADGENAEPKIATPRETLILKYSATTGFFFLFSVTACTEH